MRLRVETLLLAAALAGCGSKNSNVDSQAPTPTTGSAASSRSSHEMQEDDFASARSQGIGNVYDLISRFHPEWLQPVTVGVRRIVPTAWVDRNRLADVSVLRSVQLGGVVRVRLLSPSEAQGELGLDNLGGAIVAYTR